MISIRLEPADEARLDALAARRGEPVEEVARRIVSEFLSEGAGWTALSDDDWTRACEAMAGEVMPDDDWSDVAPKERGDGSR